MAVYEYLNPPFIQPPRLNTVPNALWLQEALYASGWEDAVVTAEDTQAGGVYVTVTTNDVAGDPTSLVMAYDGSAPAGIFDAIAAQEHLDDIVAALTAKPDYGRSLADWFALMTASLEAGAGAIPDYEDGAGYDGGYTIALGPFYVNDLPGTATTQAQLGYFNAATALSLNGNDVEMKTAGRIVGAIITADDARTAGTATVQVRINGTPTAFRSGGCALNGTETISDSEFASRPLGLAFAAGDTIGAAVVTAGWTPTTANVQVTLYLSLDPV